MVDLSSYIRQVRGTYSAIAAKIEELVLILNESKEENDPHTTALAQRIETFLASLQQSLKLGTKSAKSLPKDKQKQFLTLVKTELTEIKQLRTFITLSTKNPAPKVITKIHELYKEIEKELAGSEALARS
jgi:ferritin-like protein